MINYGVTYSENDVTDKK